MTVTLMFLFDNYATTFVDSDLLSAASAEVSNAGATNTFNCKAGLVPFGFLVVSGKSADFSARHCDLSSCSVDAFEGRELFVGFKIFMFFLIALFIVCFLVLINWVIINFKSNNRKNSPYECGFEPVGSPISDFTPNFTAVALIFLIYDVEVLLTFP
ncbi:MAG: hypothetical protein EPO11_00780 [Gammaproteobacteria bacterium]|nr:MAG: hypothetical protein EPO11_00780 [Gammaproteobacteria bacterium]